jgi:DNA anti-recombination protein RmuC
MKNLSKITSRLTHLKTSLYNTHENKTKEREKGIESNDKVKSQYSEPLWDIFEKSEHFVHRFGSNKMLRKSISWLMLMLLQAFSFF